MEIIILLAEIFRLNAVPFTVYLKTLFSYLAHWCSALHLIFNFKIGLRLRDHIKMQVFGIPNAALRNH